MAEAAVSQDNAAFQLAAVIGEQYVITDEAERKIYSNDIFF
jgi:hypothetical protein